MLDAEKADLNGHSMFIFRCCSSVRLCCVHAGLWRYPEQPTHPKYSIDYHKPADCRRPDFSRRASPVHRHRVLQHTTLARYSIIGDVGRLPTKYAHNRSDRQQ